MIAQTAIPAQTVKVALKGVMIKLAQPAVASQHLVTSQPAVANHLAANPPSINVQILVISQRRQSHHQIATMVAQNAHHQPQKSASVQRGQAVMPHRRAARAR
jgi:methionine-rich copper-binding protein CopC